MVNDPLGDMITQIRNAYQRQKKSVELPCSKTKEQLAKVLRGEGYLAEVKRFKEKGRPGKMLRLDLEYQEREPAIFKIRRLSKPGRRLYVPAKKLPRKFRGITIVSTPRGLMTENEARRKNLGGELICEVI